MQLTGQLAGKKIESVWKHDNCLVVRCEGGFEIQVAWVDLHGTPVNGEPLLMFAGLHVHAKVDEMQHRTEARL